MGSRVSRIHNPSRTVYLFVNGSAVQFDPDELRIAPKLYIHKVGNNTAPLLEAAGVPDAKALIGESSFFIECRQAIDNQEGGLPFDLIKAMILCTEAEVQPGAMITFEKGIGPIGVPPAGDSRSICWGHYNHMIDEQGLQAAADLLPGILNADTDEKYHRVGNALRFYDNGYFSTNADFALVAFTTCLEGLFSTTEQELSFRLSLRVAHFLGETIAERRKLFTETREIYKYRSKLVHGAPIAKDSEQAAIYLVEGIVPTVERIARRSLRRIFERRLEELFKTGSKVDLLFDEMLFSGSPDDALRAINN